MKILFIVPHYMGLHLPIYEELNRQGHEVFMIEDIYFEFDWNVPWRGWHDRLLRKINGFVKKPFERYWERMINSVPELSVSYDMLLCINGASFHPYLKKHLKRKNRSLKSVLYLWDNSAFYDYFHNAKYFDNIFTYDIDDSENYGVEFLPIYWQEPKLKDLPIIYDVSMIGSNHDGRYMIAKDIKSQFEEKKTFIKVLDQSLRQNDIIIHAPIPTDKVQQIMLQSKCILDTDRETQSGTTPRLIWALAMGKKIITTNRNVVRMPFYDKELISIVDRNNPKVDKSFVEKNISGTKTSDSLVWLRIDNWCRTLIS